MRRLALALLLGAAVHAAEPKIEFTGLLSAGDATRFALRDATTGVSSWVKVGDNFSGYAVTSFDAPVETIVLTKNGATLRVKLSDPKPQAAVAQARAEIETAVVHNLRQLSASADQYYLEKGKSAATLADLVGPDKYMKRLVNVAGEDYGAVVFDQRVYDLTVRTAAGDVINYDRRPPTHTVTAGETLFAIAQRWNLPMARLVELNRENVSPAGLKVGQVLKLH